MMEKIETAICQVVAIVCGIGMIASMKCGGYKIPVDDAFMWLGSYLLVTGIVKAVFTVCAMVGSMRKNNK